jgi:hypothetical protein
LQNNICDYTFFGDLNVFFTLCHFPTLLGSQPQQHPSRAPTILIVAIFDKKSQRVHQYNRYRESLDFGGTIAFS